MCSSDIITASSRIYVTDALIDCLFEQIEFFLNGKVAESYWENEEKGDNSSACVSLKFLYKDKLGHVLIEVYMELDDGGGYQTHNCCFYVNTDLGTLEKFYSKLPLLKKGFPVGREVVIPWGVK